MQDFLSKSEDCVTQWKGIKLFNTERRKIQQRRREATNGNALSLHFNKV